MTERSSLVPNTFEHAAGFDAGDTHGGIRLGKFEAQYEELFAEVIEDGVITAEERARLDRAADLMGLDKQRLRRLESALQSAFEAHHRVKIVVQSAALTYVDDEPGRPSLVTPLPLSSSSSLPSSLPSLPVEVRATETSVAQGAPLRSAPSDAPMTALQQRVAFLEARLREVEAELEDARNNVAVEVDLGGVVAAPASDDPADLQRRIRQDPTDPEPMHLLFRQETDIDKKWCIASALSFLGKANSDESTLHEAHRTRTLPKPNAAISPEAWRRLLFHPDEELLTGDIFGVITSAGLLGRVSALRRDKLLPKLDPARKQDPVTSTISAVRAIAWSAAILGLRPPPMFVDPELDATIEMIPGIPPNLRVGARLLSGRTPLEVAFECGRTLACFREEHFVRWLFPGIPELEDLFLAALSIASPGLPIPPHAKARAAPIAAAIEPVLEPQQIDRLRGYFLRFVEEGGRTNLQRWAHGVDKTACRAGLVLCNELATAGKVLLAEEKSTSGGLGERMRDLLVFATSDRFFALRRQLGIAIA